ncbi:MAG: DUF6062 family protein [Trueperaceae bacterium]
MSLLHSLQDLNASAVTNTGCLFCAYEHHQARRYLLGIANDGINDPPLRMQLSNKGGFCARHTKEFVEEARVLSSAILLEAMLSHRLERSRAGKRSIVVECEACKIERKTRDNLVKSVRRGREDKAFLEYLRQGELCAGHLELVCQQLPENTRQPFVDKHKQLLQQLAEVIRKHDYRFVSEGISEEETQSIKETLKLLGNT